MCATDKQEKTCGGNCDECPRGRIDINKLQEQISLLDKTISRKGHETVLKTNDAH